MVAGNERAGAQLAQAGEEVAEGNALAGAEGLDPPLRCGCHGLGPDLVGEREDDDRESAAVPGHLVAQPPDLVEEVLVALPHARRVRVRDELADAPDLAALGVDDAAEKGRALVEPDERPRRPRQVVLEVLEVVEADAEEDEVGGVAAGDAHVGDAFLPGGPAHERDRHHLRPRTVLLQEGLQPVRVRSLVTQAVAEGHAVTQADHPMRALGLFLAARPVADAVPVEVVTGWPSRRVGLHHVEVVSPLALPVGDAVGGVERLGRLLAPAAQCFTAGQEGGGHGHRQQEIEGQVRGAGAGQGARSVTTPGRGRKCGRAAAC